MKKALTLLGLVSLLAIASTASADDLLWPMKLSPELTSKFCDYRAGHFHSGLDIRTQGRTGIPIYAVGDGHIYRASVTFRGYGKALYLMLNDGKIAVFGHLSDFTPPVRDRIWSAQMKDSKYTQDLFFTPGEFPVRKGELIAHSGASGSGAPHLHFEIRSPQNNPVNPLGYGVNIVDKSAPRFDYLAVRYYVHGFDHGDPCEFEFIPAVKSKAGNRYNISDTLISDESLVLSVSGGDLVGGPGFLYGFFGLGLYVDDSLAFEMNSDSLSFVSTRQLNYIRDLENIRYFSSRKKTDNDANIFYRLFVPPGARQFFWKENSDGAGILPPRQIPGSVRQVRVSAYDEYKNRAELHFYVREPELPLPQVVRYNRYLDTLVVEFVTPVKVAGVKMQQRNSQTAPFKSVRATIRYSKAEGEREVYQNTLRIVLPDGDREYRFVYYDEKGQVSPWVRSQEGKFPKKFEIFGAPDHLKVKYTPRASLGRLSLMVENPAETYKIEMVPCGPHRYVADIMDKNYAGMTRFVITAPDGEIFDTTLALNPVYPDSSREIYSPDSTLVTTFQPGSAFYPTYVFSSAGARAAVTAGSGIVYDLQPDTYISNLNVRYKFNVARLGLEGKKVGIYGYSYTSGGWNFIGKIDGTKLESGGFGLGKLALIEDNDPPVISSISPSGAAKSKTPVLSCTIRDKVSGLALDSGVSMTIDGLWVPAEYDIDNARFSYKVRNPLKPEAHRLEVVAVDNQGNRITKSANFTVSAK